MKQLITLLLLLLSTPQLISGQSLIKSVLDGNTEKVKKIVLKKAKKINKQKDKAGNFALHTAVLAQRPDYIRLLAENGADINIKNNDAQTPLMLAVMSSNYDCSSALWDYQPDISVKDIYGNTVLDLVKDSKTAWLIGTPTFLKAYVNNLSELEDYVMKFPNTPHSEELGMEMYEEIRTLNRLYQLHELNVIAPALIDQKAATLVDNLEKLRDFKKRFPDSPNFEEAVRNVYPNTDRAGLIEILNIYPSLSYADELKTLYIKRGKNIQDHIESLQKFPELSAIIEPIFYELVNDLDDARTFKEYFPESQYHDSIVSNLLDKLSRSEIKQLIDLYPDVKDIDRVKKRYIKRSKSLADFMAAVKAYPNIVTDVDKEALNYVDGYNDARLFLSAVQDSSLYADAFRKGITHTNSFREVLDLKDLYAGAVDSSYLLLAEKRYLEICNSLDEYYKAISKFPHLKSTIEELAFEEVDNIKSAQQYMQYFPDSKYAPDAAEKSRRLLRQAFDQCDSKEDYQGFIADYSSMDNLYDPDYLISEARRKIKDIEEYEEMMDFCETQAKTAGNQLMRCCSSFGGRGFSVNMNKDDININSFAETITIPMKVNWYGSLTGRHYWIKGELIITNSGQRRWNKISDSGGFSPGCSQGCIR